MAPELGGVTLPTDQPGRAFGRQAPALLRQLDTTCGNAEELADVATERFAQHPDAAIITSMPGLAGYLTARRAVSGADDYEVTLLGPGIASRWMAPFGT